MSRGRKNEKIVTIQSTLRNRALRKRASQFGLLVRHSAVTPLSGQTRKPRLAGNGELGVTFIGHSSFFLQIGGKSVLIDPNFARWLFVLKRLRRIAVISACCGERDH